MENTILHHIQDTMCDVFDVDDLSITEATTARDIEEWDSLSHIRLIVAIERRFHIKFNSLEVESFKCVGDLAQSIRSKIGAQA